jgi:two-component system, OmpR family, sensor kinase
MPTARRQAPLGRLGLLLRLPAWGLRWRLTLWVGLVLVVAFGVIFAVVYQDTGSQVRSQLDREIAGDVSQLASALRPAAGGTTQQISAAATRYVRTQPFAASARLLFVLIPGAPPASNHPEVFSSGRAEPGETAADQRAEDQASQGLTRPRLGYTTAPVPDGGEMTLFEKRVRLGRAMVVVGAGQPLATVEVAQHGVASAFVLAGVLVLVLALIASYVAASQVSAPLRRMATVAARVDAGDLEPRMPVSAVRRDEVRVLTEAFNHMLDRLSEAFASQRQFLADASHELRTPLTVIRGQLEVLAAEPDPTPEEVRRVERLVQAEIARLSRLVDDLLLLSQAERTDFLRREPIKLRPFVDEVWNGLSLTAQRQFELGEVPDGTLESDADRLAQAVRNLGRNAIEHTAEPDGLVRLDVVPTGDGSIRFTVEDNGSGIPPAERERVFERFHRVEADRSRRSGGAGLGLAIVQAIAEAHGGRVTVADRDGLAGTRIELVLPGFRAS